MISLVQSSPSPVANVASGAAIAENTNPGAVVEQLRLTPQAIDDIVAQAAVIAKADIVVQQQHALASMGFNHDDIQDMLDLAAEAQAQGVALDGYPNLKRIADEMASRLQAFTIINTHKQDANPALFAEVSRGLKQETLRAALNELDLLAADLGYDEIDDETVLVDKVVNNQEAAQDLTRGLVGLWEFNGDLTDGSGHGNDGQRLGGVFVSDRFNNENSAYKFDGQGNCILVPDSYSLNIDNSNAVVFWFKSKEPIRNSDGITGAGLIGKLYTHNFRSYGFMISDEYGYPPNYIYELIEPDNTLHHVDFGMMFDDDWHLWVGTYDKSTGYSKVYLDGKLVNLQLFGHVDLMQTSVPLSIGCYLSSSDGSSQRGYFNGLLDDIRVYSRSLSHEEVMALYSEFSPNPSIPPSPSTPASASPDGNIHIEIDRNVFLIAMAAFAGMSAGALGVLCICACKQRQDAVHNSHQQLVDENTPHVVAVEMVRPSSSVSQAPRATLFQPVQNNRDQQQTEHTDKARNSCSIL